MKRVLALLLLTIGLVGCHDSVLNSCGDGNRSGSEQCDDGNGVNGDGCSAACQDEVAEPF